MDLFRNSNNLQSSLSAIFVLLCCVGVAGGKRSPQHPGSPKIQHRQRVCRHRRQQHKLLPVDLREPVASTHNSHVVSVLWKGCELTWGCCCGAPQHVIASMLWVRPEATLSTSLVETGIYNFSLWGCRCPLSVKWDWSEKLSVKWDR